MHTIKNFFPALHRAYDQFRAALHHPKVKLAAAGYDVGNAFRVKFPSAKVHDIGAYDDISFAGDEDWAKGLLHVEVINPMYRRDLFDCENYAEAVAVDIRREFGVNTIAWCWGYANGGHGWDLFATRKGIINILEPQTGNYNPAGYEPLHIIHVRDMNLKVGMVQGQLLSKVFIALTKSWAEYKIALHKPAVNKAPLCADVDFQQLVQKRFPMMEFHQLDSEIKTVWLDDWGKVVKFCTVNIPAGKATFPDALSVDISREFGINGKAWCWDKDFNRFLVACEPDGKLLYIVPSVGIVSAPPFEPIEGIQT